MKRLLTLLSNIKLGIYLLLAASALLFIGAITADMYSTEFHTLNFTQFPAWLSRYLTQPVMYLWILVLFIILSVLALNTFACIVTSIHGIFERRYSVRRISILLFHACLLLFLLGHCLYEFSGTNETLTLDRGVAEGSVETGLTLSAVAIDRDTIHVYGTPVPIHTSADIVVRHDSEPPVTIRPEAMKPAFAAGYTFHIAMKNDDSNSEDSIKIIVRQDYGLYALAAGGLMALIAILLYTLSAIRSRPE